MLPVYLNISFAAYFLSMFFYFAALFFKHKALSLAARIFLCLGVAGLTAYMLLRWQVAQRPPLSNMFESVVLFAWVVGLAGFFIDMRYRLKILAALVSALSLLTLGISFLLDKEIVPLLPALKSNWLTIHVLTCFIGYAALTVGFVASVVLLLTDEKTDILCHKP